jgi:hypothetical protein
LVVSRIESGRHRTSNETLRRLVEALEGHAVLGFEFNTAGEQKQELSGWNRREAYGMSAAC